MNAKTVILGMLIAGAVLGTLILRMEPNVAEHEEGEAHEDFERGPHNGRLLRDGKFSVEMTIFEDGVPPEFRVYAYQDDKPLPPKDVALTVQLNRLGGAMNAFRFVPTDAFLRGQGEVHEPHSFDVKVTATAAGKNHSWSYASYEGRTQIADETAAEAGVKTMVAGPTTLKDIVNLTGQITVDPTRSALIRARFPGVVRELRKNLGDRVAKNEVVATIESNESLQAYQIRSPVEGVVIAQFVSIGEVVDSGPVIEISDVSRVVAELHAFPKDAVRLRAGQPVQIAAADGELQSDATLTSVLPTTDLATQTTPVRVILDNKDGAWRPGRRVDARITAATREVPLGVLNSGLQSFRDMSVVYAKVGDTYEVRMLTIGVADNEHTEVLGGLDPGTAYVTENAFLIKADIEKSGASHDH